MELPVHINRDDKQSLQNQIFEQIRKLILSGHLQPKKPLPASRVLADQLGVSRNTVILAYERLINEGYLQTRMASRTFVSANLPEKSLLIETAAPIAAGTEPQRRVPPPIIFRGRAQMVVNKNRHKVPIDFWVGRPNARSFPTKTWRRLLLNNLSRSGANLTEYGNPAGLLSLRSAIANHLGPARGIRATPDQIIIVTGIQEALNIVARLFVERGVTVATENPCYQGAAFVFESYGARLLPVHVDSDGLNVADLVDHRASLVYVTPSHQYPTGRTLSLDRRIRLLDWAWTTGAYIVEDDYDSDFRYDGPPLNALAGLDRRGCVIYLGTFSKSIGAGLRIGYMVVPTELQEPAVTVKTLLNNGHAWLDQAVLADFVGNEGYIRHLRRIRRVYMSARDCLVESLEKAFGPAKLSGLDGGMHIMWHLPPDLPAAHELQAMAQSYGVGIYTLGSGGAAYDYGGGPYTERAIMLGYSSLTEKQIREGIGRIAAVIAQARGPTLRRKTAT
jgi:GntR family transcriptional regulator/MocR family aminotransferase